MARDYEYFLRRIESEGWRVIRVSEVGELDAKGKPSPNAGELVETIISYPGRQITTAAKRLLDLGIPDGTEVRDIQEWRDVYEAAADRVVAAVQGWIDRGGK